MFFSFVVKKGKHHDDRHNFRGGVSDVSRNLEEGTVDTSDIISVSVW